MLVKICGVRRAQDAQIALDNGADVIGIILVPNRGRTVSLDTAKAIRGVIPRANTLEKPKSALEFSQTLAKNRPILVGVFMNQPVEEVVRLQKEIGLDVVQLHGSEDLGMCDQIPVPVIKRFTPTSPQFSQWQQPKHSAVLVDGEVGGTGELVDWELTRVIPDSGSIFILGGGLTPENVHNAALQPGVFMVDVSSGVEGSDGYKDAAAVQKFIEQAKLATKGTT